MSRGIALHIGVNNIDREAYQEKYPRWDVRLDRGWLSPLNVCSNSARAFGSIALHQQFDTIKVLTNNVEVATLEAELMEAAEVLQSGDMLFLTFSGHGVQRPQEVRTEVDGLHEAWCLYDDLLTDRQLYYWWSRFRPGVRILVFSDSCCGDEPTSELCASFSGTNPIVMEGFPIQATVRHITACKENQESKVSRDLTLFTRVILEVWNKGCFKGSYSEFFQHLKRHPKMSFDQKAQHFILGEYGEHLFEEAAFAKKWRLFAQ